MINTFLKDMGWGPLDMELIILILLVLVLLLIILSIVGICSLSKLKKTYGKFMSGKSAKSLENEIVGLFEDNKFLKTSIEKNRKDIKSLSKNMELCFQKVGIIKYNAFNQMGGNLSFSLALLDDNNNGFILNSVHSTEGCYSYTKEVKNGSCDISLSEEEKKALDAATGVKE